jgi:hypothetical protein
MKSPIDQMQHVQRHMTKVRQMFKDAERVSMFDRPTYEGAELRPFAARPGAMDTFDKPSLVNGERMPAKKPKAQCVGTAQALPFSYPRGSNQ